MPERRWPLRPVSGERPDAARAGGALLGVLLLAGTSACPGEPCTSGWSDQTAAAARARVVLAAWADGGDERMVLVGGGLGVAGSDGLALVRAGDGGWAQVPGVGGRSETLWWAWNAPETATDLWMVGEAGLILRWDGRDGAAQVLPSGTTATLFGVWGSAKDDVWIVGGSPVGDGPDGVILHWDGAGLTPAAAPGASAERALFKVWGSAKDDLWIVGQGGTLLHGDGATWTDAAIAGVSDTLLTVHGCAGDDVWAVGGRTLLHYDGGTWSRPPEPVLGSAANGVACGADHVLVVGNGGLKWRFDRATSTWHDEQLEVPWDTDYHGAVVAPGGELWAVGGNFNAPPQTGARRGVVARFRTCR